MKRNNKSMFVQLRHKNNEPNSALFDGAVVFTNPENWRGFKYCIRIQNEEKDDLLDAILCAITEEAQDHKRRLVIKKDMFKHHDYPNWISDDDVWVDGYWLKWFLKQLYEVNDNIKCKSKAGIQEEVKEFLAPNIEILFDIEDTIMKEFYDVTLYGKDADAFACDKCDKCESCDK
jgi:hypothetical protein